MPGLKSFNDSIRLYEQESSESAGGGIIETQEVYSRANYIN